MIRRGAFVVLMTILSFTFDGETNAQVIDPALEQAIAASGPDELLPVIVTLSSRRDLRTVVTPGMTKEERRERVAAALRSHAIATQAPLISRMLSLGAINIKRLWIINSVAAHVPAGVIDDLAAYPGVNNIRLDSTRNAPVPEPGTAVMPEWNIDTIQAPALWNLGFLGQGVVVASLDTGVELEHPDLLPRWRGGTNSWHDPYDGTQSPFDINGHGTQVMGLIVGGDAGGTAIGVAPGAKWIAAKIFDNSDPPQATLSVVHGSFQWLLDPDGNALTDDAPDLVNASFGFDSPGCDLEFAPDIVVLKAAAIAFVAAGGNFGPTPATSVSPANNPKSFAVGSVDAGSGVEPDSSRGPSACDGTIYPGVVAPGVNVDTADFFSLGMPVYISVSGTSFAAPHVSGAMALLLSASPDLTPDELETGLKLSALDIGAVGPDNDTGYGLIDIMAAFNWLGGAAPIDADGDSYVAGADCNDNNPSIFPGAVEIKFDGIDQDCNGYDLTIKIVKAKYDARNRRLRIEATSRLGKHAQLTVVGYGPMTWSRSERRWVLTVKRVRSNPGTVTVSGIEGAATIEIPMVLAQVGIGSK